MKRLTYILLLTLLSLSLSAQEKIKSGVEVSTLTDTKLSSNLSSSVDFAHSDANERIASLVGKYFLLYAVTKENFGFLCEVEATRRVGGRTTASLKNAIGNLHSTKYLWTLEAVPGETNHYYIRNALGEYLPKVPSTASEDIENPVCVSTTDRGRYEFVQHWGGAADDNAKWGIKSVDKSGYFVQYNSYGDNSSNDEISICVIRSTDERHSRQLSEESCVKFFIHPVDPSNLESYTNHVADLLIEFKGIYSHFQGNERYVGALSKEGQQLLDQEIAYYSQSAHQNDFTGARNALIAVNAYKNLPDPNKKYIIESAYSDPTANPSVGFVGDLQAVLEYDATNRVLRWRELTSTPTHTTSQLFQFEKIGANIVGDVSGAGLYRIKCYGTNLYVGHSYWAGPLKLVENTPVTNPSGIPSYNQAAVVELVEKENIPGQFSFPAHYDTGSGKDYCTMSLGIKGAAPAMNGDNNTYEGASYVLATYNGNWFSENQPNCFYIREVVELPALQSAGDASFVSTYALDGDFKIPTGVRAWTINRNSIVNLTDQYYTVAYSELTGKVPANEGVLLTAESQISSPCYLIEKRNTAPTPIVDKALFGVNERSLVSGYKPVGDWSEPVATPYALANKDGLVAFYPYQPLSGYYSPNHAYLDVERLGIPSVSGAKGIVLLPFDGSSTGISNLTPQTPQSSRTLYNIIGQRINNIESYHGIIIKNGKKVIKP